jgi:hypothetical protein
MAAELLYCLILSTKLGQKIRKKGGRSFVEENYSLKFKTRLIIRLKARYLSFKTCLPYGIKNFTQKIITKYVLLYAYSESPI